MNANTRLMRGLAAVTVAFAVLFTSGCGMVGGANKASIKVYLSDSAGLFVGNDVGVLGVTVGKIVSIEPEGDKVLVTLEVDGDQPVPADAGAVVVARSVATDRYLELTPVYREGAKMADGATIPVNKTQTPVDFDQVLESLNEFATGIGGNKRTTKAVQKFIDAGTQALQGRGPLVNQTIHSLADGVGGIAAQREDIAATLRSLDVLLTTIAANESTARRFIQEVSKAADLLSDERENFRQTLRSLDTAVTTVAKFAVDNRQLIVDNLNGGTRVMKTILSKQGRLEELLRVFPLALQNLERLRGNRATLRIDPLILLPLGDVLQDVCGQLPGDLCGVLLGTTPGN